MQSPLGDAGNTPSKIGRSALPEASELALLRAISISNEFTKFGSIFKDNIDLFGSTNRYATQTAKKLREAVNSRKGYLFRNPSFLVHILEQRRFAVPDYIQRAASAESQNPQEERAFASPTQTRRQQKPPATMTSDDYEYVLNLEEPWKNPEGILPVLVPDEPISGTQMVSKIAVYV
jgi:hypothetical protein